MGEARRKSRISASCAYCGSSPATTRDHVPPRSIFSRPYPADLTIVPCCNGCNEKWSPLDEEFRTALSMLAGVDTSGTRQLWKEKVLPGLHHNRRRKREILGQLRTKLWIQNRSTGKFEQSYVVYVEAGPYITMIQRITRGLYYREIGSRFPEDVPISVDRLKNVTGFGEILKHAKIRNFGSQFSFAFFFVEANPFDTLWLYAFHQREFACTTTGVADDRERSENDDVDAPPQAS